MDIEIIISLVIFAFCAGAIDAAVGGGGLIQIPAYDVRGYIDAGDLVEVMPDYRAEPMPMTLLYPHRQGLPRRAQIFAAWLEDLLARDLGHLGFLHQPRFEQLIL
mgnify:CR=1 FL=1